MTLDRQPSGRYDLGQLYPLETEANGCYRLTVGVGLRDELLAPFLTPVPFEDGRAQLSLRQGDLLMLRSCWTHDDGRVRSWIRYAWVEFIEDHILAIGLSRSLVDAYCQAQVAKDMEDDLVGLMVTATLIHPHQSHGTEPPG
jgi:hypothetical protein